MLAVPGADRPSGGGPGGPRRRRARQVAGPGPGRVRRLFLDLAPLRLDRDFRWLFLGQTVNGIGNQITRIALPYQVYVLTGSTLAIAALTLCQLVPILAFSLGGGVLADAVDRRRLLFVTQVGLVTCSGLLALLALSGDPPLVALLAIAFVSAGLAAVDQPTRSSAVARIVPAERLPAAIALNTTNVTAASVAGPAIGGILIATIGLAGAYLIDVATFAASLAAVIAIRPIPPLLAAARPGLAAIREGLAFTRDHRVIQACFAIDLNAMIFGMPMALFPALALDVFRVGPEGFGLLSAAVAAGGLAASLLSGWVGSVRRAGLAVVLAVTVWAVSITLFGLSTFSFAVALAFLALAGAADVISAVFRNTITQLETPDPLRGRVSSIHTLVVTSGPRIGDIEAAALAAVVGVQASVVSGGLLCLLGVAVVAWRYPELVRHRLPTRGAAATPAPQPEAAS